MIDKAVLDYYEKLLDRVKNGDQMAIALLVQYKNKNSKLIAEIHDQVIDKKLKSKNLRKCGACDQPHDTYTHAKLKDINGNGVTVCFCKPCIDKVQKQFDAMLKPPVVESESDQWSTACDES